MKFFLGGVVALYLVILLYRLWFREKLSLREDGWIVREIEVLFPRRLIRRVEIDPATILECNEMRTPARSLGKEKRVVLKSWVIIYRRKGREKRLSISEAFDPQGLEVMQRIAGITAEKKAVGHPS